MTLTWIQSPNILELFNTCHHWIKLHISTICLSYLAAWVSNSISSISVPATNILNGLPCTWLPDQCTLMVYIPGSNGWYKQLNNLSFWLARCISTWKAPGNEMNTFILFTETGEWLHLIYKSLDMTFWIIFAILDQTSDISRFGHFFYLQ